MRKNFPTRYTIIVDSAAQTYRVIGEKGGNAFKDGVTLKG